jgi:tRNA(fMet)-specific endonuclease VapC
VVTWLLDTNICIAWLNGKDAALKKRILSTPVVELAVCSMVKAELHYGARHSQRVAQNLERLAHFLAPFESLAFDDEAAEHYGVIRNQLAKSGQVIGANDLCIAAIAMANDVTLVTRNEREFRRVAGLKVVKW